jgi:hypothetical protein
MSSVRGPTEPSRTSPAHRNGSPVSSTGTESCRRICMRSAP